MAAPADLIARNGDARSRAGRPPSSDLAMGPCCGASSDVAMRVLRSVATAGDLAPSSAISAMLQLDVRGLVVGISSDAAMLERGEKTASGRPRRQVCMRFREEETAPAIRNKTVRPTCSSATLAGFFDDALRCFQPHRGCAVPGLPAGAPRPTILFSRITSRRRAAVSPAMNRLFFHSGMMLES